MPRQNQDKKTAPKTQVWVTTDRQNEKKVWLTRWVDRQTGKIRSRTHHSPLAAAEFAGYKRGELASTPETAAVDFLQFVAEDVALMKNTRAVGTMTLTERAYRRLWQLCQPQTLAAIDVAMLERFRAARLLEGITAATVNADLRTLAAGLSRAVRRGYLAVNPFFNHRSALFLTEPEPVPVSLEAEEFEAILKACPTDCWRVMASLGYWAGLRLAEILALEWVDVDFKRDMIHVRNKSHHRTKSGRNRSIPMAETLKRQLYRWRVSQASHETERVIASTSRRDQSHKHISGVSSAFALIVRAAGLVDADGRHKYSLHDLRRTCITEWLRAGLDVANVKEMAGHSSLETTMKYYAAVKPELQAAAVRRRG